jgi:hypothetical protein
VWFLVELSRATNTIDVAFVDNDTRRFWKAGKRGEMPLSVMIDHLDAVPSPERYSPRNATAPRPYCQTGCQQNRACR